MKITTLKLSFAGLVVLGIIAPYAAFISFVIEHGLDISLLLAQAAATRIAAFAWLDVIVSALALLLACFGTKFVRLKQATIVTFATLLVGPSAGLPLFFYFAVDSPPKADSNTH